MVHWDVVKISVRNIFPPLNHTRILVHNNLFIKELVSRWTLDCLYVSTLGPLVSSMRRSDDHTTHTDSTNKPLFVSIGIIGLLIQIFSHISVHVAIMLSISPTSHTLFMFRQFDHFASHCTVLI